MRARARSGKSGQHCLIREAQEAGHILGHTRELAKRIDITSGRSEAAEAGRPGQGAKMVLETD